MNRKDSICNLAIDNAVAYFNTDVLAYWAESADTVDIEIGYDFDGAYEAIVELRDHLLEEPDDFEIATYITAFNKAMRRGVAVARDCMDMYGDDDGNGWTNNTLDEAEGEAADRVERAMRKP